MVLAQQGNLKKPWDSLEEPKTKLDTRERPKTPLDSLEEPKMKLDMREQPKTM